MRSTDNEKTVAQPVITATRLDANTNGVLAALRTTLPLGQTLHQFLATTLETSHTVVMVSFSARNLEQSR
jgi:hypothetical protein